MSLEFLLVAFPEDRDVLADGDRVGVTGHTILINANEYTISLSGNGYEPATKDVVVAGTSIMRPKLVAFSSSGDVALVGNKRLANGRTDDRADGARSLSDTAGLSKSATRINERKSASA